MKTIRILVAAMVIGGFFPPMLLFSGEDDELVAIRLVEVEPASFSTIERKTVLRFEVDVEYLSEEQSADHPVLISIHFESKEAGKSVSRYMEAEFDALPRISESQFGLVLTYPIEHVRQQRNLKIPVVARVVATVPSDQDNRSPRVGASDPVTFYVSENW